MAGFRGANEPDIDSLLASLVSSVFTAVPLCEPLWNIWVLDVEQKLVSTLPFG